MIKINTHTLSNGLQIVHNYDATTKMVALNILYDVGSRDERAGKTGLAHYLEHLMFGGSANAPDFDTELQRAGGENNAWTSSDYTNYYDIVPAHNIETAFWLESDRMQSLALTTKSIETQRNVVIEEFKQRYLNTPYGDLWHIIRETAYKQHPYSWQVIGKSVSDIEGLTATEIRDFWSKHYSPSNAILSVSGDIQFDRVIELSHKWFGSIASGVKPQRNHPTEPIQTEMRTASVKRSVPQDMLAMAYHTTNRMHPDYYTTDLISDILSNGNSSRLYRNILMSGSKIFTSIDASITGSIEEGLFIIQGKLHERVTFDQAIEVVNAEIAKLINEPIPEIEIEKCINKIESRELFTNLSYSEKASNIGYCQLLGDAEIINTQISDYRKITEADIKRVATEMFRTENCNIIQYGPNA